MCIIIIIIRRRREEEEEYDGEEEEALLVILLGKLANSGFSSSSHMSMFSASSNTLAANIHFLHPDYDRKHTHTQKHDYIFTWSEREYKSNHMFISAMFHNPIFIDRAYYVPQSITSHSPNHLYIELLRVSECSTPTDSKYRIRYRAPRPSKIKVEKVQ